MVRKRVVKCRPEQKERKEKIEVEVKEKVWPILEKMGSLEIDLPFIRLSISTPLTKAEKEKLTEQVKVLQEKMEAIEEKLKEEAKKEEAKKEE